MIVVWRAVKYHYYTELAITSLLSTFSRSTLTRMMTDRTQLQGDDEHRESRRLSLERTQPPAHIPGYEPQKFLGAGAYGEVWVALNRNTGRQNLCKKLRSLFRRGHHRFIPERRHAGLSPYPRILWRSQAMSQAKRRRCHECVLR